MGARYLQLVEANLVITPPGQKRDLLAVKKAAYLARIGEFRDVAIIISNLRDQESVYQNQDVSIYLSIVDGLLAFYQDNIDAALDRFRRSNALSKASGLANLVALSSSWLAHLAFGRFDFDDLVSNLTCALSCASRGDHDCLTRLCLVVAQTLHLAADPVAAKRWYTRSRLHAIEIGDEATISAIMYNMTVMQIVNCRQTLLSEGSDSEGVVFAVSSAESTNNFDQLAGIASLENFTPILLAQTYSLAERYLEAEHIYSVSLATAPSKAQARSRCWLLADRALCLIKLGNLEKARDMAEQAVICIVPDVQVDDVAATHSRLATVFSELGELDRSRFHEAEAKQAWGRFKHLQCDVAERISQLDKLYEALR